MSDEKKFCCYADKKYFPECKYHGKAGSCLFEGDECYLINTAVASTEKPKQEVIRGFKYIRSVKIGNLVYGIEVVDKFKDDTEDNTTLGNIDHLTTTITIRQMAYRQMVGTLMHEITHGILFTLGYHEKDAYGTIQDENFIQGLSQLWHSVLLDNPTLLKELQN